MKEQHIVVQKTARYFTLGELNEHTKKVWFVLHGFGQMAGSFIKNFEALQNEHTFIVAPEALNHFYLKGAGGNVGATWMTKEDRLNEIKDYTNYLDALYEQFELEQYPETKVIALGFSQGASTVTRWANATRHRIDTLIVYAGEVAAEVLPVSEHSPLHKTDNHYICGTQDSIFTPPLVEQVKANYTSMNFTYTSFNGGHEIQPDTLKQF